MKFENAKVFGFENAVIGARLPMCRSFDEAQRKCDATSCESTNCSMCNPNFVCDDFIAGDKDIDLLKRLIKADENGSSQPNSKFLRMIHCQVCITAPVYILSEIDTYKVGTTRNSTSIMHKGMSKPFEIEDFTIDNEIVKEIVSLKDYKTKYEYIKYPYETDEYKIYTTFNGRQYEVYKNGRIFACPFDYTDTYGSGRTRHFERTEKKPYMTKGGYFQVNLGGRNCEKWLVHRLVAYCWLENPNNYETVDHLNCDKSNNSVENLEWVSREENVKRQNENGLNKKYLKSIYLNWKKHSKLTPFEKIKIKELYNEGNITQEELARKYNVKYNVINNVVNEKTTTKYYEDFEEAFFWEKTLEYLNDLRDKYLETKDYQYFRQLRQALPASYNYVSMMDLDYATLRNMYYWRCKHPHRLTEWSKEFKAFVETLPYSELITC